MKTKAELTEMLAHVVNTAEQRLSRWEREFLFGLTDQWERYGRMSVKQEEVLTRIYEERAR